MVKFAARVWLRRVYASARCGSAMRRYYTVKKMKEGGPVKDACYKKVKSSYKVFPSAYASGAIAKCRKKAAK